VITIEDVAAKYQVITVEDVEAKYQVITVEDGMWTLRKLIYIYIYIYVLIHTLRRSINSFCNLKSEVAIPFLLKVVVN
jgi:hypothetical protein